MQVMLVDDIDESAAAETVSFGLDGITYEIDLNEAHSDALRGDLAKWIGHGRRTGGRKSSAPAGATIRGAGRREDLGKIREWARDNGFQVSDRGRISAVVQEAYDAAHK
ncbi:MAG: Lsr2 family protein [Tetrasphaera sp.]